MIDFDAIPQREERREPACSVPGMGGESEDRLTLMVALAIDNHLNGTREQVLRAARAAIYVVQSWSEPQPRKGRKR